MASFMVASSLGWVEGNAGTGLGFAESRTASGAHRGCDGVL
jgi:hypothetical protein